MMADKGVICVPLRGKWVILSFSVTCNTTRRIRHRHTHTHTNDTKHCLSGWWKHVSPTHTHTQSSVWFFCFPRHSFPSSYRVKSHPPSVSLRSPPPLRRRRLHHSGARLCIRVNISTNLYKYISRRFNYLGTVVLSVWSVRFLNPHEDLI